MSDIASSLTATHREVRSRRIAAGEARTALMRRRYDAPIEDVWDACTDPEREELANRHRGGKSSPPAGAGGQ